MKAVFLLLATFLVGAGSAWAQEGPVVSSRSGVDRLLLDEVGRIAARVETLRGESFVRPPFAVRVPDDMRQVAAEIRAFAVLPRDRVAARGRAWADVGLGDAQSPRRLLFALAADLDGIGFDPQGNRLLVTPGCLRPEDFEPTGREGDPATVLMLTGMRPDETIVGHLLTHVRQRERSGRDSLEATTDRLLAASAWAEGEANVMAAAYLFSGIKVGRDVLQFVQSPGELLDGALLPSGMDQLGVVERQLIEFVYLDGFEHAAEQYREGGWKALDRAVATRRTTRDLLHLGRAPLSEATFPAVPDPPRPGMQTVDVDTLGEQAIVVLVSTLTQKDGLGLIAGEGWAGDRLYRWEPSAPSGSGAGMTEWVTRWRSTGGDPPRSAAEVAADFDHAYGRALEARFPGRTLEAVGGGSRTLVTADRVYRIERRVPGGGETADEAAVRVLVQPLPVAAPPAAAAEPVPVE